MINIENKYIWIGVALVAIAFVYQENQENKNLSFLIKTQELEAQIQDRQLMDLTAQMRVMQAEEYNKGFASGKSQAALALMNDESLMDYADGYHAALEQFGSETPYDSETIKSLNSIDKTWQEIEQDYLEIIELLTNYPPNELEEVIPVASTEE